MLNTRRASRRSRSRSSATPSGSRGNTSRRRRRCSRRSSSRSARRPAWRSTRAWGPPRRGGRPFLRREGRPPDGGLRRRCSRRSSIPCSGVRPRRRTPAGWCGSDGAGGRPSQGARLRRGVHVRGAVHATVVPPGPRGAAARTRRARQLDRTVETDAFRGDILDRAGRRLVHNRLSLEVRINRDELGDEAEATLAHLSEILGVPPRISASPRDEALLQLPAGPRRGVRARGGVLQDPRGTRAVPGVEVVEQSVRATRRGRSARTWSAGSARSTPRSSSAAVLRVRALRSRRQGRHRGDLRALAARRAGGGAVPRELRRRGPPRVRSGRPPPATTSGSRSTSTSSGSPRRS